MPLHYIDTDGRYLCIKACRTTKEKSVYNEYQVNCKNCLRELRKNRILERKWKEIIAAANDGDPKHSFNLFQGLMKRRAYT